MFVFIYMRKWLLTTIVLVATSGLAFGQGSALDKFYQDRITSSINLGKDLLEKNEKESAVEYFLEAIGIAEKRSQDPYAGFLVVNNEILEPTIDWLYSLDSLDKARHLVRLYEKFYDGTETTLKDAGSISDNDYYGYMMFCYNKLMLITSECKDYDTSIHYGKKYIKTAKSQGVFNDDYLEWHKTLVWSQILGQEYGAAFTEAAEIYDESLKLGHTEVDALQMIHSVHDFAMNSRGLYWYLDDVSLQKQINDRWLSFLTPLYEKKEGAVIDKALMQLDGKTSMREELRMEVTSSTRLATILKDCCLAYKLHGYDAAKERLFQFKNILRIGGHLDLWQPACVSFFEFLQSMQQHSAVYSFCKLIENDFSNKEIVDLEDYLTFYAYYFGACDRVSDIRKSLEILFTRFEDESIKESPLYWEIARLKGSCYTNYLHDFEKGLENTLDALRRFTLPENPRNGDLIQFAGLYGYVGDVYRRLGNYEEAIKYYQEDLKICLENNLEAQKYAPLFYLGRSYHAQKDYEKSQEYFIQCAEMKNETDDSYNRSAPFSYLFDIERTKGNYGKAREYLSTMWRLQLQEYLSFKDFLTVYEQTAYWAKQGAIDFIGGLVAESSPTYNDIYYDMLLTSKGFMQKAETKEYLNVISSGNERLISLYGAIHSGVGAASSLVDEYMTLYRNCNFSSDLSTPSWKEVQKALGKDDIAIEFYKYQIDDMYQNPQYGALILKRGLKAPIFIHLCSEKDLKQAMKAGARMYQINDLLYHLIWEPLQKEMKGVRNIYFSPHELMHTINLSAIEDSRGRPLFESYSFHRLSSTYNICEHTEDSFITSHVYGGLIYDSDDNTMIAEHRKYAVIHQSMEWVADTTLTRAGWAYLPNTELELQDVVKQLKSSGVTVSEYSGSSGTEESFKALSGKHPGHIHLATHGFYLRFAPADSSTIAESPEKRFSSSVSALTRSGLILSNGGRAWKGEHIPDGIDDGILQADEIAGLDLSGTSLLVLSACQTALGDISSDGVYGLQRAFKNAGVETIIMSLWEVDDKATFEFMTAFYRALTKGRSKHDAFCETQRQIKKNYEDPYYWAAFIMLD